MASPADLITLVSAKAYLGSSAGNNDAKLQSLITSISLAILPLTNRTSILPKAYTEVRNGNPRGIFLRNWPVQSVSSVTVTSPGFGGTMTLYPASTGVGYVLDAPDDPPPGQPQMLSAPFGGMCKGSTVTVSYIAGYQVNGEVQTVPPGGGAVSVLAPYGAWGSDQGVVYATGASLKAVAPGSEAQGAYSVAGGLYTFSAADAGAAVAISYGYIPADLANACLEWLADRLAYQDRIGVASKSLGGQETVSYRISQTPAFVTGLLAAYSNLVPLE